MDNPKIKIESDGLRTEVWINGEKVKNCTQLDFHADVADGFHVKWSGKTNKCDESGRLCIENDEIVKEEFCYDNNGAVIE